MSIQLTVTRHRGCESCRERTKADQFCGICNNTRMIEEPISLLEALPLMGLPTPQEWAQEKQRQRELVEKTLALELQICELRQQLQELAEPLL